MRRGLHTLGDAVLPDVAQVHANLARSLSALGQGDEARAAVEQALRLDPELSMAHVGLGHQLYLEGRSAQAVEHFRRALRLDPSNRRALASAGAASFELGDYAAARRFLRAAASDPSGPPSAQSPELRELLDIADLVIERDPLQPRLSSRDRWNRLLPCDLK